MDRPRKLIDHLTPWSTGTWGLLFWSSFPTFDTVDRHENESCVDSAGI